MEFIFRFHYYFILSLRMLFYKDLGVFYLNIYYILLVNNIKFGFEYSTQHFLFGVTKLMVYLLFYIFDIIYIQMFRKLLSTHDCKMVYLNNIILIYVYNTYFNTNYKIVCLYKL